MSAEFLYELDAAIQIADGNIENFSQIDKFGRNPNMAQDTTADIWDHGIVGGTLIYEFPNPAGELMTISSDNNNDGPAGEGAKTARVFGLDANYDFYQSDPIVLNGLTAVSIGEPLVSVYRVKILSAGTNDKSLGNIYVGTGTDGTGIPQTNVYARVAIGNGQTLMTPFIVPVGYTGFVRPWDASIIKTIAAGSASIEFLVRPLGEVFQIKDSLGLRTDGNNAKTSDRWKYAPLRVEEKSQIKIQAFVDGNGFIIDAGYPLLLRKN